ncbi:MAG: hypothetical protein GXZ04_08620 [Clostridiales bacterium]|nr:hypothetical protein [Clostridiales bacterium]
MEYPCELIADLLPLYEEGLASGLTKTVVETHLKGCPACQGELADMRAKGQETPEAALPLITISRGIKMRRLVAVLLAASLILALAVAGGAWLTDRQFLDYDPDMLRIEQRGEQLVIGIRDAGVLADLRGAGDPDRPGAMHYELQLYTQRLTGSGQQGAIPFMLKPGEDGKTGAEGEAPVKGAVAHEITLDLAPGMAHSLYYAKPGEKAVLIWGADMYPDGGYGVLPRLALVYYEWVMLAAALLLGLLLFIFYKKEKLRRVLKILLGLPVCYLLGQLLVKGFSTLSYDSLYRDLVWILVCAAFLYATWLLFWYQMRLHSLER